MYVCEHWCTDMHVRVCDCTSVCMSMCIYSLLMYVCVCAWRCVGEACVYLNRCLDVIKFTTGSKVLVSATAKVTPPHARQRARGEPRAWPTSRSREEARLSRTPMKNQSKTAGGQMPQGGGTQPRADSQQDPSLDPSPWA